MSALLLAACGGGSDDPAPLETPALAFTMPQATVDIANYIQTGRYSLPVGSGTNLLAQEASAVAYNKDTDTLFILGDEGTSIVQVSKQGTLIDSMTLGVDAALPQGTFFYDPEGLAYAGNGRFAMVLERDRQVNEFAYAPNTTLTAAGVKSVKLGTTVGNIGIEGLSLDPATNGYVLVKESGPSGIFQTTIDFAARTASNGSPTTENSTNLFDPAKAQLTAFSDVFALSNVLPSTASDYRQLLIVSGPDGKVRQLDRAGNIIGTLDVGVAPQNEGMTMDAGRNLYIVNEIGGGTGRPEMLMYKPTQDNTAVGRASNLYLTFAAPVVAGAGNITLSNGEGDTRSIAVTDTAQVSFKGATMVVNPSADLLAGSTYRITYAAGLVKDAAGTASAAVTGTDTLSLKVVGVVDTAAPLLSASTPADNATGANAGQIVLTFNEAVQAGTGSIVLSNGSDTRSIAVSDATQVAFSGSNVTITPTTALVAGTAYNLQLASGVIKDAAGNAYAGIADPATLNFTLAPAAPSMLAAGDLIFMAANGDVTDAFAFVLLKPVTAGTQIGFTDRDYSASTGMPASGESAFVWTADVAYAAGTIVTIQPDLTTPVADKGLVSGRGGGISTTAETIYAFQGAVAGLGAGAAGAITVDRFIAAVNVGGGAAGDIPAGLASAGGYIGFAADNARYNGSLDRSTLATFAALVRDPAQWLTNDAAGYPLSAGSLYP